MKKFATGVGLAIILLFSGCSSSALPDRNCPLAFLMPDTSVFPYSTKHLSLQSPAPKLAYGSRGVDSGFQEYQFGTATSALDQLRATHEIQRWSTISVAQRDYIDRRDFALQTGDRFGPWTHPSAITFTSRFADEAEIACGNIEIVRKMYRCWMVGRFPARAGVRRAEVEPRRAQPFCDRRIATHRARHQATHQLALKIVFRAKPAFKDVLV